MWDPEYRPDETFSARWQASHMWPGEKYRHGGTLVLTSQRLIWLPGRIGRWRWSRQWECDLPEVRGIESARRGLYRRVMVDCPTPTDFIVNQPDSLIRMVREAIAQE